MEAEYTSLRLAELVMMNSVSRFDFSALCDILIRQAMLTNRNAYI